jgi:hypothetical protein
MPVNWDPLSVMMEFGTPNRWMMSVKNDTACSALRLVIGHSLTHLENLSTAPVGGCSPRAPFARA